MRTTVIRQSRTHIFGMGITSVLILLYCFFGPYGDNLNTVILPILIFSVLLVYSIFELTTRKGEIILSEDGIEIRGKGWNHWDYVYTYWTIEEEIGENSSDEFLVVQLKDMTEIRCKISNLEKNRQEIIGLIAMYKRL